MVSTSNNNKFYEMVYDGKSSTFQATYGRIEKTSKTISKPYHDWDSVYDEKINKGYTDVTKHTSTTISDVVDPIIEDITDKKVNDFITLMKRYTDKLVSTTYSVKSTSVTQSQLDEAQKIINELTKLDKSKDENKINQLLVSLYVIIPRQMSKVQNFILPVLDFDKAMIQEQDNLDAMASQVNMNVVKDFNIGKTDKKQSILTQLGIDMKSCTPPKEMDYLIKQLTSNKVRDIFEVKKSHEDKVFEKWLETQDNKSTRTLIHGTRCTSVIPILEQGLKIRPVGNFQYSGKAYGDGNYFSEVVQKSLGYTGYDNDRILLVYEVHTGNPFIYEGWYRGNSFSLTYSELNKRGYHSTHVKAGNGLLNSEIIVYREEQCRIKNIIWLEK